MSNNLTLILIVCIVVGAWGVVRAVEARSAERIAEIQARTEAERQKQFERLARIVAGREP